MPFDYKKEYKEFYLPKDKPGIVTIPPMNYIAVRGQGDPNAEDGEYQQALGLLYGVAYTIKMSKKGSRQIEGYFDYVVPPLEGFWWQDGMVGVDYGHKELFRWISVIRLPDFVTRADFDWAVREAAGKKKTDFSRVEFLTYDESIPPPLRSSIILELQLVDIFNDVKAYLLAKAFAQYRGYKICIDGITVDKLQYINRTNLNSDFMKII